jgi:hypothetical protein
MSPDCRDADAKRLEQHSRNQDRGYEGLEHSKVQSAARHEQRCDGRRDHEKKLNNPDHLVRHQRWHSHRLQHASRHSAQQPFLQSRVAIRPHHDQVQSCSGGHRENG